MIFFYFYPGSRKACHSAWQTTKQEQMPIHFCYRFLKNQFSKNKCPIILKYSMLASISLSC
ncbi:MAG: hypothetical protein ACPL28_12285, partial [bacterium]